MPWRKNVGRKGCWYWGDEVVFRAAGGHEEDQWIARNGRWEGTERFPKLSRTWVQTEECVRLSEEVHKKEEQEWLGLRCRRGSWVEEKPWKCLGRKATQTEHSPLGGALGGVTPASTHPATDSKIWEKQLETELDPSPFSVCPGETHFAHVYTVCILLANAYGSVSSSIHRDGGSHFHACVKAQNGPISEWF